MCSLASPGASEGEFEHEVQQLLDDGANDQTSHASIILARYRRDLEEVTNRQRFQAGVLARIDREYRETRAAMEAEHQRDVADLETAYEQDRAAIVASVAEIRQQIAGLSMLISFLGSDGA